MKKLFRLLLCCAFALGFVGIIGSYGLKAEDNAIVADLDGDGTEEVFFYEFDVTDVADEQREYKFYILQDGDKIWSEDEVMNLYLDDSEETNFLHHPLYMLGDIRVQVIDVNSKDKYKEIILNYYSFEDNMLLGIKVLRYKKGKLTLVSESYDIPANSYVLRAQKKNKNITIATDFWTTSLGCIWLKVDYKLSKNALIPQVAKSGVYEVAPEFAEDYSQSKFKAARSIKVYSDKECTQYKGEIKKGKSFTLKKVVPSDIYLVGPFAAYVKASGIKGWIVIDNESDEYGAPADPIVKNRRLFS